jgi:thioredoxin 1
MSLYGQMPNNAIPEITRESFDSLVLKPQKIVIVEIYSELCPPCRAQEKILSNLTADLSQIEFAIYKVDKNAQPALASNYGVNTTPTLLIFRNGRLVEKRVGFTSRQTLQNLLNKING